MSADAAADDEDDDDEDHNALHDIISCKKFRSLSKKESTYPWRRQHLPPLPSSPSLTNVCQSSKFLWFHFLAENAGRHNVLS